MLVRGPVIPDQRCGVLEAAVRCATPSIYDPTRFLAEGMVSLWAQRSSCHNSNPLAPVFVLMHRAITIGFGVVFTSYALDLKTH
jgi:hypothetical protein